MKRPERWRGPISEKTVDELLQWALETPHKSPERMCLLWEIMERENPDLWENLREAFQPIKRRGRPKLNEPRNLNPPVAIYALYYRSEETTANSWARTREKSLPEFCPCTTVKKMSAVPRLLLRSARRGSQMCLRGMPKLALPYGHQPIPPEANVVA